jgi:hypothetical protein
MAQLLDIPALEKAIGNLEDLSETQKQRITDRWLTYVIWWDSRASKHKRWHYRLRTIVVIGGVVIPALIGTAAMPNLSGLRTEHVNIIQWGAFALSLLVGICTALEELFHHGDIWRDKRAAGEILKCEGWRYFQLIGKYKDKTHQQAYADFAATVEDIIEHEIKDYFLINRPQKEQGNSNSNSTA